MIDRMLALGLCVAIVHGCAPQRVDTPSEGGIFRHVVLNQATVHLGQPLPSALGRPPAGDSVLSLTPDQFGGAQAIRIHLMPAGIVRAVSFDYAQGTDYSAMLADYAGTLGAPRRESYRRGERAVWEDAATRFEVVRDPERSVSTVFSILSDRRTSR